MALMIASICPRKRRKPSAHRDVRVTRPGSHLYVKGDAGVEIKF